VALFPLVSFKTQKREREREKKRINRTAIKSVDMNRQLLFFIISVRIAHAMIINAQTTTTKTKKKLTFLHATTATTTRDRTSPPTSTQ